MITGILIEDESVKCIQDGRHTEIHADRQADNQARNDQNYFWSALGKQAVKDYSKSKIFNSKTFIFRCVVRCIVIFEN